VDILSEVRNHVAFITLNRPAALNALSLSMIVELRAALHEYAHDATVHAVMIRGAGEKAFCAGGDIRALYESHRTSGSLHVEFFATEYPLDYVLYSYPKPYVALLNGIVMGGGMGISQGSRLRIVGERTRMAMPEVAIGFFPDVGASYFLSRLPGCIGLYLALTGAQLRAADALYAELADFYLPPANLEQLDGQLQSLHWGGGKNPDAQTSRDDILKLIRALCADAGTASLAAVRPAIDEHFSADSVPALLQSLQREARPEFKEWAQQTAALIATRSPTMLAVTLKQLRLGRSMTLAQCLRMEIGMAKQCFAQGDFIEGVRAMIIDKDNKPVWRPNALAEVTQASVDAIFANPWVGSIHPLAHLEQVHA
jgi:enoyl-CoA hydratase/carnithine racemase